MRNKHIFILSIFLIISSVEGNSQTVVGQISPDGALLSNPKSIDLFGTYAIVASVGSNALEIIDVTDPSNPVHKNSIKSGPNVDQFYNVSSVVVSGNLAFATNGSYLSIIDISNPAFPSFKSSTPISQYGSCQNCSSLYVVGNYAYIMNSSFLIFDISDPNAPVLTSFTLPQGGSSFTAGAFSGNKAYVTNDNSLMIIDVSNPGAPIINGTISDGDGGASLKANKSVAISGTYAYVTSTNGNAIEVVDVSNPATPVHAGNIVDGTGGAMLSSPQSITVIGALAYVASTFSNALEILDISNPVNPIHKASFTGLGPPNFLTVENNFAYILDGGVEIIDVSNPSAPSLKGSIANGAGGSGQAALLGPSNVVVSGNYAYVACTGSGKLEIIDVSNPSLPTRKSNLATGSLIDAIFSSGNLVYLISTSGLNKGVEIIDVSDPSSPYIKGTIINGQGGAKLVGSYSLFVQGNYAYVVNPGNANAFEIIDISNPSAPAHKGSLAKNVNGSLLRDPLSVVVVGNYAYLTDFILNLVEIIDISNPASPAHVGSIADGDGGAQLQKPSSIATSGNYLFVASEISNALEILDISNPTAPSHVGSIKNGQYGAMLRSPVAVTVSNNYAFLRTQTNLEIVDISDPKNPTHAGSLPILWGYPTLLGNKPTDVQGNYAYMTGNNGLQIVSLFSPALAVASNATAITSTGFTANWSVVPGVLSYQVDVSPDNFNTFITGYNATSVSGNSLAITWLAANTVYQYRVRAVDANGTSLNSKIISATTLKIAQNIAFGSLSNKTYGDAPFTLSATTDSGLTISYTSSDTTVAKVNAGSVIIVGAGTAAITAKQEGNAIYFAATDVTQTLTIKKAAQSITFSSVPAKTVGDTAFHVTPTATSKLVVVLSSSSKIITLSGNKITIIGAGSATIMAKQSGNVNYDSASSISQTFCINPAKPSITLAGGNTDTPTLSSSLIAGNQWFLNGNAITGATNPTLTVNTSGSYTLQTSVDGCTSKLSDVQAIVITEVSTLFPKESGINLFPNPANTSINISSENLSPRQPVVIQLYDVLGHSVEEISTVGGGIATLDLANYAQGTYLVKVLQSGKLYHAKFYKK